MRFVKGVVDCEDIPLNISRETFQDSALMAKLKNFLTKRIIKLIKDEAEKNPEEYVKWFQTFATFIKEGSLDPDFKTSIVRMSNSGLSASSWSSEMALKNSPFAAPVNIVANYTN